MPGIPTGLVAEMATPDFTPFLALGALKGARKGLEPVGEIMKKGKKARVVGKAPKVGKYAFNINLDKLDLSPSERKTLTSTIDEIRPLLEKVKGKKLSLQEVVDNAAKSGAYQKVVTKKDTLFATSAVNKARQNMAELDKQVTKLAKAGETKLLEKKMKELVESVQVVSSTAADWGRKLKSLDIVVGGEPLRQKMLAEIGKVEKDTDKIVREAVGVDWSSGKSITEFYRKYVKPSAGEVLREFRYQNMLSNPRTHERNLFSNIFNTILTRPATKLFTEGPVPTAKYYKGVLTSLPEAVESFGKSLSGEAMIRKPDIRFIPTGKLPQFYTLPSRLMEAGDVFFSTLIRSGEELAGKTPKEAAKIAEYSLFRAELGSKTQGHLLRKIDQFTAGVYQLRKVGLDWFIPFVQTPMNYAKQWIEYAPTGVATIPGATKKKEQVAKTILGSIATLIGAKMAIDGNTAWEAPRNEEAKKLFYESGRKRFSVKIGGRWIPMIYAGPFALALAIPAAVKYYQDENKTALTDDQLKKLGYVVGDMANFFSQQTFLTGLGTFVNLATGRGDYTLPSSLAFTAGQVIPLEGLVRYVTTILDPVYRKGKGFKEGIKKDLPFLSRQLEPYTTPSGEPARRGWSSYLAPYDIGAEKPGWSKLYKQDIETLQQKSLLNKLKQAEPKISTLKPLAGTEEEKVAAYKKLTDKRRQEADRKMVKQLVFQTGQSTYYGGDFYYLEDEEVKSVDADFRPEVPTLTGLEAIDKKLKSKFKGEVTKRKNIIVTLFLEGELTADEAEKLLIEVEELKNQVAPPKGKKPAKVTFRKITAKKLSTAMETTGKKPSVIKIKKPPTIKIKKPARIYSPTSEKGWKQI
jgi:hypothetical protein